MKRGHALETGGLMWIDRGMRRLEGVPLDAQGPACLFEATPLCVSTGI